MKIPQVQSNNTQKTILWITILLATTYYVTTLVLTNGQTEYVYIDCPEDAYQDCLNPLYQCKHNIITIQDRDSLCAGHEEEGKKICAKHPQLCENPTIPKGTTIGEKPPFYITQMPLIISIMLILGTLLWYKKGDMHK